jgi:hypothetical protein
MLKEITEQEWSELMEREKSPAVFEQVSFARIVAEVYGLQPRFYTVLHNQTELVAAFIAYSSRNELLLPVHFFYSAFYIPSGLRDFVVNKALKAALDTLKKQYKRITLKLPPAIQDVRAFTWAGFRTRVFYTYIKDLQEISYSENIRRQLKKASALDVAMKIDEQVPEVIAYNMRMMQAYGMGAKGIAQTEKLISLMAEAGLLHTFYLGPEASAILFQDARWAYLLSIAAGKEESASGLQAQLYHDLFHYYQSQGQIQADLLGGNLSAVSEFKSKLNAQAMPYYTVEYSATFLFDDLKNGVRKTLKRILGK